MDLLSQMNTLELTLAGFYLLLFVIQMVYFWVLFSRLAFYHKKQQKSNQYPPVSVVIAAKDECRNLKNNLPAILEQDYPGFEVVVVNHASVDETKSLLKELSGKYNNLKPVHIEQDLNFFKGKKFPLSIGIKSAKNELLLLTDADCTPATPNWIKEMVSSYTGNTEVVLGYGPYKKEKGLLNLLIRFDTFLVAVNYLSFALAGKPYMGVGRNLSYKKSLFIKNKGFISHYNIASGDDDLFISQVANKKNTAICIEPDSFVFSEPKKSLKQWIKQKRRHFTTGKKYKLPVQLLLGLFTITQWLFYVMLVLLLSVHLIPRIVAGIYLIRAASQQVIYKLAADKLKEKQIFVYSLLLEPLLMLLIPLFSIRGLSGKSNKWK